MPSVPRPNAKTKPPPPKVPKPEPEQATPGTTHTPNPSTSRLNRDDAKLRESLRGMYEGVGMLAMGVGIPRKDPRLLQFSATLLEPQIVGLTPTGEAILGPDPRTGAEKIADAWMTAADRNPRIKTALRRFTEGGAIAEVAALHISLLLPFLPGIPGLAFLNGQPSPMDTNGATRN